ncbi:MAG: hypothetical protein QOJ67_567 [Acidimicrobiaceae bacterium]
MRGRGEEQLITPAFVWITTAALAYFVAIGVLAPVLPRYVEDELGGGGVQVGLAVGAFAVSAALLRPTVGRIGDQRGRRVLVIAGALIAAVSVLGYDLAVNLPVLIGMRLLTGVGEAAIFVGAATAVQDLAPSSRRGEATSYFSIAVYGGLGIGPVLGEYVRTTWGFHPTWAVAAGLCLLAMVIAAQMPDARPVVDPDAPPATRRWLHPAAVRPGVILALSSCGYAGFGAFVPLYIKQIGLDSAGGVFLEYAVAILAVRILAARLPDRIGSVRGASIALLLQAGGLGAMAVFASAAGLYAGTLIFAMGTSLLYPSLFPLVVDRAPDSERSQAVATFTLFFDVAQGLGAFVLGAVVSIGGNERWAFAGAAALVAFGFVLLRSAGRSRYEPAPSPSW